MLGGGEIDLRQIFMTKPIIDAVKIYNPDANTSQFKIMEGEQGFPLSRIERMMQSDFDDLLQREPIELRKVTKNGRPVGLKIDGVLKQSYEIINGRHRITRAIIEGRNTINATIV